MQTDMQLVDTALLFYKLGKVEQCRKIAQKLIQTDRARLLYLSRIDIDDSNFRAVMDELNDFEYLTGRK